jgi:hypothetical protein
MSETVKKKTKKRLSADDLKNKVEARSRNPGYDGVAPSNVKWETLRFDDTFKRQTVEILTVDENGLLDGNTRVIATSDLQHTKHTKEVAKSVQKKRVSIRRKSKRSDK